MIGRLSIRYVMVTDIKTALTYIIEPASSYRHSRLRASVMTARGRDVDTAVPWRSVPAYIRVAAAESLSLR